VNIVRFQPWDFDNNKIFVYLFLIGSLIIGYFFDRIKFKWLRIPMIIFTFLLIFSGIIDVVQRSSLAHPVLYKIFDDEEIRTANWITANIPYGENILTGSSHLNLVASLAGKPILMGYPGWLWTHGIDYQKRDKDIRIMFTNKESVKLFKKYNIGYAMIGQNEKVDYKADEDYFDQTYPVIYETDNIKIYRILND
jgi:uncharacterized membrane protein